MPLAVQATETAGSQTVFGPSNPALSDGASALEAGRYEEGIRLTLQGLEAPASSQDRAAGHSNLCAGYAALKRWDDALVHCNAALELDRDNWRAYNNRAAVFVGKELYDLAVADVQAGLQLNPGSRTLRKSLQIVLDHKRLNAERRRSATRA